MGLALTRTAATYPVQARPSRPGVARDYGELASKLVILTLFSSMSVRLATDAAETGHVTGILLLVSEALVVALTLVRRTAGTVDRTWRARFLTIVATFGPPLVRPTSASLAPETVTIIIASFGLMIVVLGKLSLGRSFGLTPANRGVVSTGLYKFVRHPIYLGYLITHLGFFMADPTGWNAAVILIADSALILRALMEERVLSADAEYQSYCRRVGWHLVPGVF